VVTGAGSGIGAAAARGLAADGFSLVLVGRRVDPAADRFGGVDVLVNNGGVGDPAARLDETLERWESTLRTNLTCVSKAGLIMLARCVANDYGRAGVRANAVCPGWVRTRMGDEDTDALAGRRGTDREAPTRWLTRLTRWGVLRSRRRSLR